MGDLNTQIAILLAKLESSDGVDPTPAAATDAIQLIEPFDADSEFAFRTQRPKVVTGSINHSPGLVPKGRFGRWASNLYLRGTRDGAAYSASNLPEANAFLQSAGMSATVTVTGGSEKVLYKPAATSLKSHTEYYYRDGKLKKLLGARSDIAFSWDAGGPATAAITRTGLYQAPTDVAVPASPVFGASVPPVIDNVALTIDGFSAGIIRKWTGDLGNTVAQRANANVAGALAPHRVRAHAPRWSVVLEAELIATKDFEALQTANTGVAISWFNNASQYNRLRWSAPNAIIEDVKESDDNGTLVITLSGGCYDSTPGANDAFQLTFE
jgi:hypothetical protein